MEPLYTVFLEDLIQAAFEEAEKRGAEDFAGIASRSHTTMTRFSNDSVTVTGFNDRLSVDLYLGYRRRRMAASIHSISEESVLEEVVRMIESAKVREPSETYASLPSGEVNYPVLVDAYDQGMADIEEESIDIAESVIDSSRRAGAKRTSGTFRTTVSKVHLVTSGGRSGEFRSSRADLNVRAFTSKEASGFAGRTSSRLGDIEPEQAGMTAGEMASRAKRPKTVEPGEYDLLLSRGIAGNLFNIISTFTSSFYVESGISPFIDRLGDKVFSDKITMADDPTVQGNPGAVPFDAEGVPTSRTTIFEKGELKTYLHNTATAKKADVDSTGHAGWIVPSPRSVVIDPGDVSPDEALETLDNGIYFTNTWYTRFQNYRTGEFSTLPRDAAFLVEDGEVVQSLKGARISDSLTRLFSSVRGLTSDCEWVVGWDFNLPSLLPEFIVEGATITSGFK